MISASHLVVTSLMEHQLKITKHYIILDHTILHYITLIILHIVV